MRIGVLISNVKRLGCCEYKRHFSDRHTFRLKSDEIVAYSDKPQKNLPLLRGVLSYSNLIYRLITRKVLTSSPWRTIML